MTINALHYWLFLTVMMMTVTVSHACLPYLTSHTCTPPFPMPQTETGDEELTIPASEETGKGSWWWAVAEMMTTRKEGRRRRRGGAYLLVVTDISIPLTASLIFLLFLSPHPNERRRKKRNDDGVGQGEEKEGEAEGEGKGGWGSGSGEGKEEEGKGVRGKDGLGRHGWKPPFSALLPHSCCHRHPHLSLPSMPINNKNSSTACDSLKQTYHLSAHYLPLSQKSIFGEEAGDGGRNSFSLYHVIFTSLLCLCTILSL